MSTETGQAADVTQPTIDMKLEVVVLPVADVDRALAFYRGLGWRLDAEYEAGPTFRIVQLTPPGSACSVHFGRGLTSASPGSAQGTYLVVTDLEKAREDLLSRGVEVSGVYHNVYDSGAQERVDGPSPDGRSYANFATFADPDGNTWVLQEVTQRAPGR